MKSRRIGSIIQQSLIYVVYFAPRGRDRLLVLGEQISQAHLNYDDRLIGIIGDAGSGKSSLIKGMFPGLELLNHDDGMSMNKIMQMRMSFQEGNYDSTTYHFDMRFQTAFMQMYEIAEFVKGALERGKRVIIEHFELLYPYLKINADFIIGVGDEIIVTRPTLFGPLPGDIHEIVFDSLNYRKMAHSAEDITKLVMEEEMGFNDKAYFSDVRRGFVLNYSRKPPIDLDVLEKRVLERLKLNESISYYDEDHIKIGENTIVECNGPRIHVSNTSEIKNFTLLKEYQVDQLNDVYAMVGLIGDRDKSDINKISAY